MDTVARRKVPHPAEKIVHEENVIGREESGISQSIAE
jgi:hypothetical protein